MNNNLVVTFLSTTYSMQQARARLRLLRSYVISSVYEQNQNSRPPEQTDPWLLSLGDSFFKAFNQENIYQNLQLLEQTIKNIIPLVLYVAFDMPEDEVNRLGPWIRQNFGQSLIFETKIDPNIIAGCAISWKGKYRDYSLRAKIDDNKDKILTNLKSFSK